jgi:hypothetical protein
MVQVGGVITKCHALNTSQNLFCLALGFVSLPWGLVIKFIPLRFFQCVSIDDAAMDEEALQKSVTTSFKRASTMKSKKKD